MRSSSNIFSRKGNSESSGTFIVKELELTNGKIMVFSSVSISEQLNFAEITAEMLLTSLQTKTNENIFTTFSSSFEEVNHFLLDKQLAQGVSATVMFEQGTKCYLGWLGDISVFLRTNEQLQLMSKGQTLEEMLDAADLDSDESHHHLFEVLKTNIALGILPQLDGAIQTVIIHPKKGDVILFSNKNLQDNLFESELEVIKDHDQLITALNTLLIEASINSPYKTFICISIFIEESEQSVTTTEHLFSKETSILEVETLVKDSKKKSIESSSNAPFYILGSVITLVVSFGVIVLLGGVKKNNAIQLITSFKLGELIAPVMKQQLIHSKNDTLKIVFKGTSHEIVVTNGRIITPNPKTSSLDKNVQKNEDQKVEVKKLGASNPHRKKQEEEKKLEEDYTKKENKEVLKEIDPMQQLKKNKYVHVVEKGEGFSFIIKKYEKIHPDLTQKKLIEFNLKSDKFVGSRKEFEKGNLHIGMELEIPRE
jgi:hypothetical protein